MVKKLRKIYLSLTDTINMIVYSVKLHKKSRLLKSRIIVEMKAKDFPHKLAVCQGNFAKNLFDLFNQNALNIRNLKLSNEAGPGKVIIDINITFKSECSLRHAQEDYNVIVNTLTSLLLDRSKADIVGLFPFEENLYHLFPYRDSDFKFDKSICCVNWLNYEFFAMDLKNSVDS